MTLGTWEEMETITYLRIPEDLMYDIFLRLPVKSLLRFKCICKIWLAQITSPDFVQKYLLWEDQKIVVLAYWSGFELSERHGRTNAFTLFVDETFDKHEEPDLLKIPPCVRTIRGPCNGIFCILSREYNMALWNPATRRMKPLPAHPKDYRDFVEVALGFDTLNDEFKVIIIAATYIAYKFPYFSVYTSSNDSWRLVKGEALEDRDTILSETLSGTTFVNGFYYWFRFNCETHTSSILEFHMHDEVFERIEIPEIMRSCTRGDLSIYDGSLVLFAYDVITHVKSMDIWTMKEKGCWMKLLTYVPSIAAVVAWPSGFWTKNKIIFVYNRNVAELVVYDLDSRHTKRVKIEKVGSEFHQVWVYYYRESLVSVKGGCGSRDYEIHSTKAREFFTRSVWDVDDLL